MEKIDKTEIILLLIAIASFSNAATITTNGSGVWSNASIWDSGTVPTTGDKAVINNTVNLDIATQVMNLAINSGKTLNLNDFAFNVTNVTTLAGTLNANASNVSLGSALESPSWGSVILSSGFGFYGGTGNHIIGSVEGHNAATGTWNFTNGTTTINSARTNTGLALGFGANVVMNAPTGSTQNFTRNGNQLMYMVGGTPRSFYNLEKAGSGTLRPYSTNFNQTAYTLRINNGTTYSPATAAGAGGGYKLNITKTGSADDCDGLYIAGTLNGDGAEIYSGANGYAGTCYDANLHATTVITSTGKLYGGNGTNAFGGMVLYSGGYWNTTSGTTYLTGYGNTNTVIYYTGTPNITGSSTGTIVFNHATGTQSILANGGATITFPGNVVVSKGANSYVHQGSYSSAYAGNIVINGTLSITQGSWKTYYNATNAKNLTIRGNASINGSGTVDYTNSTITINSNLNITDATLSSTGGEIAFSGGSNSTISSNKNLGLITISNSTNLTALTAFNATQITITSGGALNFTVNDTTFDAAPAANVTVYPTATTPTDPENHRNISKYLNITSAGPNPTVDLKIYYSDSDWNSTPIKTEDSLDIFQYGSWNSLDATQNENENWLSKIITSFTTGPFAILGQVTPADASTCDILVNANATSFSNYTDYTIRIRSNYYEENHCSAFRICYIP